MVTVIHMVKDAANKRYCIAKPGSFDAVSMTYTTMCEDHIYCGYRQSVQPEDMEKELHRTPTCPACVAAYRDHPVQVSGSLRRMIVQGVTALKRRAFEMAEEKAKKEQEREERRQIRKRHLCHV